LNNPDLGCDLLVHQAGSDQAHDFLLTRAERIEPSAEILYLFLGFPPHAIALEGCSNSIQKVLLTNWFGQKLNGASFHGLYRHWDIAKAGNENDWNIDVHLGELGLEIEPAQSRQSDIQYQATDLIR